MQNVLRMNYSEHFEISLQMLFIILNRQKNNNTIGISEVFKA